MRINIFLFILLLGSFSMKAQYRFIGHVDNTKWHDNRPCGNGAANYKKKKRLESIDDVPLHLIGCVYSRAKRRGPVPGKAGQVRKADSMEQTAAKRNANLLELGNMGAEGNNMMMNQQAQLK